MDGTTDAELDEKLMISDRAQSGYKYVSFEKRTNRYFARFRQFRSKTYRAPKDAARALARFLVTIPEERPPVAAAPRSTVKPIRVTSGRSTLPAAAVQKKTTTTAGKSRKAKTVVSAATTHSKKPSKPRRASPPPPAAHPPPIPAYPADWMSKPNISFDTDACDLFGTRLMICRTLKSTEEGAVIKAYQPASNEPFGIVYDSSPDSIFFVNLFRKSCPPWRKVPWEDDDIWETQSLRPMCPACGHPLGEGKSAWTVCVACGEMEPGVMANCMLRRTRVHDPYRRDRPNYADCADED